MAQLLTAKDAESIIKQTKIVNESLLAIQGTKVSATHLIETKLGIVLQKLANKCVGSSQLANLGEKTNEVLKKLKEDVLKQIFGEELKKDEKRERGREREDAVESSGEGEERKEVFARINLEENENELENRTVGSQHELMDSICRKISKLLEEV